MKWWCVFLDFYFLLNSSVMVYTLSSLLNFEFPLLLTRERERKKLTVDFISIELGLLNGILSKENKQASANRSLVVVIRDARERVRK